MPEIVLKVLNNEQVVLTKKGKIVKLGLPKINKDNKIVSIQWSIARWCG